MRTLQEALSNMDNKGGAADTLKKHLDAAGITKWKDFSKESLYDFADGLKDAVAPSTARVVCARLKTLLNRYSESVKLPEGWEKIIKVRGQKPVKTYLNEGDLLLLERVEPKTEKQRYVLNTFLVCAYTGLRLSDALTLTPANIVDGKIHYVAQKTKKEGVVPAKPGVEERIAWLAEHRDLTMTTMGYNVAIRDLCRRAGINSEVVVFKGGVEKRGPKWKFISSHSARVSLATCLDRRGVPFRDVMQILQHSDVQTTSRYIVREDTELSSEAMEFFK